MDAPESLRAAADRAETAAAETVGWQRPDGADTRAKQENGADPHASGFNIGDAPAETDQEAYARLARLPRAEYDRVRVDEAKKRGLRAPTLDEEVRRVRGNDEAAAPGQGRPLHIARPVPWPAAVNGAELLGALAAFLARHVFLPPGAADALAAWTLHTYCFSHFRHSPRVVFTSPEKRCGKTTALDSLGLVVCASLPTANITAAALFRTIELTAPTLLIDEADTFLRGNEDLRGALNAGHKRGGQVIRCVGDDAEPRAFAVFAPAAIAAIRRLPGTIEDRALVVRMKRATRAEQPVPLDAKAEAEGARLAKMCARWAADHADKLAATEPALPPALFNRVADNWRPLFAIAEMAGGDWPGRLTTASAALSSDDDEGLGIRLLEDIRAIFAARKADQIASADLCKELIAIETSPWSEVRHGSPITQNVLARLLRPFEVVPGTVRLDGKSTPKGYKLSAFSEAWRRYLPDPDDPPPAERGEETPHRHKPQETAKNDPPRPPHGADDVAVCEDDKPRNSAACGGVAARDPEPAEANGEMWETEI
jgi:putative DNA primase/helicase